MRQWVFPVLVVLVLTCVGLSALYDATERGYERGYRDGVCRVLRMLPETSEPAPNVRAMCDLPPPLPA